MTDLLFISDLHLNPSAVNTAGTGADSSAAHRLFRKFATDIAAGADRLYILGDFLEVWWGDDAPDDGYRELADTLRWLNDEAGTEICLMHGNRDFLIGQQLAERWHFRLIEEPYSIDINGTDALLMHGDSLCTDDVEYQRFRSMVRDPAWQQRIMQMSLEERFQMAAKMREDSKQATSNKAEDIMDVNPDEVRRTFIDNDVDIIIHGHTHRPAIHHYDIEGSDRRRIVLGDWHDSAQYLHITDATDEIKLSTIQL